MIRSLAPRILLSAAVLVALLVAGEWTFRILGPSLGIDRPLLGQYKRFAGDGQRAYVQHPYTVFRRPKSTWFTNAAGFRDDEWTLAREPGVRRILCLGGSTTEGGNLDVLGGSYPPHLEQVLEERSGLPFEVLNGGVSGWTTAETLIAWFLLLQDYAPDLVVLHHAVNDVMPRNRGSFRSDYSHWRKPWSPLEFSAIERALIRWSDLYAWLRMDPKELDIQVQTTHAYRELSPFDELGALPPGSENAFRRNIESIGMSVTARGGSVLLLTMPMQPLASHDPQRFGSFRHGIAEHNRILRELAAEHDWLVADAAERFESDRDATLFVDLVHLTPEGNDRKADVVADVLLREWLPR